MRRRWSNAGIQGRGKREFLEKIRLPAASSSIAGVSRPGIEPSSPWWEASMVTGVARVLEERRQWGRVRQEPVAVRSVVRGVTTPGGGGGEPRRPATPPRVSARECGGGALIAWACVACWESRGPLVKSLANFLRLPLPPQARLGRTIDTPQVAGRRLGGFPGACPNWHAECGTANPAPRSGSSVFSPFSVATLTLAMLGHQGTRVPLGVSGWRCSHARVADHYSLQSILLLRNQGSTVEWVLRLRELPVLQTKFDSRRPDSRMWESLASRFSRSSPVSPAFLYTHLASPSSALRASILRAAPISSLHFAIKMSDSKCAPLNASSPSVVNSSGSVPVSALRGRILHSLVTAPSLTAAVFEKLIYTDEVRGGVEMDQWRKYIVLKRVCPENKTWPMLCLSLTLAPMVQPASRLLYCLLLAVAVSPSAGLLPLLVFCRPVTRQSSIQPLQLTPRVALRDMHRSTKYFICRPRFETDTNAARSPALPFKTLHSARGSVITTTLCLSLTPASTGHAKLSLRGVLGMFVATSTIPAGHVLR
ncbi:hypothetical protein PR048_022376 [Dryococelus australis]|uniref:Uncharacterized protein n=1 Tax=Dryococelus australis TaxID=614101 RepID=A0ABQ9H0X5_9NEOP|nr:hypothetical protein PR048_022376 [Dryococelus australis]